MGVSKLWDHSSSSENQVPAWPDYPSILTTLLAAVCVIALFLGVGTLTNQGWVTWTGLVVAAGVLASHVVRYQRATRQRAATQELLRARLIGYCKHLDGANVMHQYYEGMERVVLVLTEDALHICPDDYPLKIFTTLPLYEISEVEVGGNVERFVVGLGEGEERLRDVLNLTVQMKHGVARLIFGDFEKEVPAALWANALRGKRATRKQVPAG